VKTVGKDVVNARWPHWLRSAHGFADLEDVGPLLVHNSVKRAAY